jgi:hypothetical protein
VKLAWLVLLATACQRSPSSEPAPAAAPSASAAASAAAPAAPAKAWYEGAWQGAYQAELFRVEVPVGGVKEWKQDDGKRASGPGQLSLQVSADGSVTGTATGPLGELGVAGRVDGDRAALTLSSATADGFHGVVLASRTPSGMQGTLSASSADSLQVRSASVTLARADK